MNSVSRSKDAFMSGSTSIVSSTGFNLPALIVLVVLFSLPGCGREKGGPLELTSDQIELKEREAIERLKEVGCKVAEVDDPLIGTSGILVTLYPEHFTTTGMIRSEVMSQFRYLRKLFLVVDATPVSADGLAQLRTLNNLLLVSAQWTMTNNKGLSSIEGIVSLRLLRLNWTPLTDDGLQHIERLPKLTMLYLSGTRVTDDVVDHIKVLDRLKALQLSHTGITDAGIAALKGFADLTHLGLDGTVVSDASVNVLASFKSLKYLNIADTDLTKDGRQQLREALPDCEVVTIAKSRPTLPTLKHPGPVNTPTEAPKRPNKAEAIPEDTAPSVPAALDSKPKESTPVDSLSDAASRTE